MGDRDVRAWSFLRRQADLRPWLRMAAANASWHVADRVVRMAVGFFVTVWLARHLGPNGFGILSYALAVTALAAPLAGLGLVAVAVRDIVREPPEAPRILGTALTLQAVAGVCAFALCAAVFGLLESSPAAATVGLVLAATLLVKAADAVKYWFEAQVQSRYTLWVENAVFLLLSAVKVLLIAGNAPVVAFAWAILAEAVLVAAGLLFVYVRRAGRLAGWRFDRRRASAMLAGGLPLMLSGLVMMVYLRVDQLMIARMLGPEAVGIYSAAMRVAEAFLFLPTVVMATLFPFITRARTEAPAVYRARLQAAFDGLVAVMVAIAVVLTLVAKPLTGLLFGPAFDAAAPALALLAWCGVFASLSVVSGAWYVLEGLQALALARNVVGMLVNVLLNLVLIPRYGIAGAAAATLVAQVCAAVLFDASSRVTREIFLMKVRALAFRTLTRAVLTPRDKEAR